MNPWNRILNEQLTPHADPIIDTNLITSADCLYPPPACPCCSGSIGACLATTTVNLFGNRLVGKAFLLSSFCEGCDSLVFDFVTQETQFPLQFCGTILDLVCCTDLYLTAQGAGTFVFGGIPFENQLFTFGFGHTGIDQCSFNLSIKRPVNTAPYFTAADTVDCSNIRIMKR